jgi:putative colanic acid biosynthesis acetyltransferase WcaF
MCEQPRVQALVDLARFENSAYDPGRSFLIRSLWFFVGQPLLRCPILTSSSFRRMLLRMFGAKIGLHAVIKPGVRVKYPWNLVAGDACWLGEDCWIDNLATVTLGDNVCISQGAYLCTGSHDWSDPGFALITRPITIGEGGWLAARASVGPGVVVGPFAVAGFGSVITRDIPAYEVHSGNPGIFVRRREINSDRSRVNDR